MKNVISVLVIGKSGTGKSEFILSLIDEEHRKMIPASGKGQTTRSSMEYNIDYTKTQNELEFKIQIKTESEFVAERMQVVERYFAKAENSIKSIRCMEKEAVKTYYYDEMEEKMIYDDAFFNCTEFGEVAEEKTKTLFVDCFRSICDAIFNINEADDETKEQNTFNELEKIWEKFWREVYACCRECILCDKHKIILKSNVNESDVELFLKVSDKGESYSALVKSVDIYAKGNSEYQTIMERNKIEKVVLVDTYGLDHAEQISEVGLEQRYKKLFREEYPDIKSVFYLRNIAAPGSPSDLQIGITTLFKVEPAVIPYVVFTFLDEVFDPVDSNGFIHTKAYYEVDKMVKSIRKTLMLNDVSESLIENRIEELLKTRIGYASKFESNRKDIQDALNDSNIASLEKVFSSIRFEKYLGNAYIPIKMMKLGNMANVLSVEALFRSRNLKGYESATKGAIRRRIQPSPGRILGFDSSTHDSVLWSDIIANDLNIRFQNVIIRYNWKDYLEPEVGAAAYEEIIKALENLFIQFSNILYTGITNRVDDFKLSRYGDKITKCLYEDRKNIIDADVRGTVGEYLTDIYDFESISSDTKEKIQQIVNIAYEDWFISSCRAHNARKIAEKIGPNTTYMEKEIIITNYYSDFEENMSEEEKCDFEKLISDYITV